MTVKKELTPRKRQALEMRAKIQNTALTLFNREGFENVSVEEIAQTVGCSVGNIYHYFKSKDELAIRVTQMVDEAYTDLEQSYLASASPPGKSSWTSWAAPWRSAPGTKCSIRPSSTACATRSRRC